MPVEGKRSDPRYRKLLIYVRIGSETDQSLLADAEERGTKQLGVVAGGRLVDWYRMQRQGTFIPSGNNALPSNPNDEMIHPDIGTEIEDEWPE